MTRQQRRRAERNESPWNHIQTASQRATERAAKLAEQERTAASLEHNGPTTNKASDSSLSRAMVAAILAGYGPSLKL